jgi:hypothetical protein
MEKLKIPKLWENKTYVNSEKPKNKNFSSDINVTSAAPNRTVCRHTHSPTQPLLKKITVSVLTVMSPLQRQTKRYPTSHTRQLGLFWDGATNSNKIIARKNVDAKHQIIASKMLMQNIKAIVRNNVRVKTKIVARKKFPKRKADLISNNQIDKILLTSQIYLNCPRLCRIFPAFPGFSRTYPDLSIYNIKISLVILLHYDWQTRFF